MELGTFEAEPLSYQFGSSSKKGTECVSVTFRFTEGENAGKRISWTGYFTDLTAKRTMDALEYCGWDGVDLAQMKGFGTKRPELVIEEEQGQDGRMYPRVQWVNRSRGFVGNVYEPEQVQSLAQRMAALNAERRRENAEKAGDFNHGASAPADPFGNG